MTQALRTWQISAMRGSLVTLVLVSSLGCTPVGEIFFESDTIEFGPAVPGLVWKKSAYLHSQHGEPLTLDATVTNPAFEISFPESAHLPPWSTREVVVSYRPTPGTTGREEGSCTITTEVPALNATLNLSGLPTDVDCSMPEVLDFGSVLRGDTVRLELPIKNSSSYVTTVTITDPARDHPTLTFFSVEGGAGAFSVAPGETHSFTLSFTPTSLGDHALPIRVKRHAQLCDEQVTMLVGRGDYAPITWTPALLDFGDVAIGTTGRATVTFSNAQFVAVTLRDLVALEASGNGVFHVGATSLTLPAATKNAAGEVVPGTAPLELEFTPATTGARAGRFTASLSDSRTQPTISVNLRGTGTP